MCISSRKNHSGKIFELINNYMNEHELRWDREKSLLGSNKGAISRIITIAPHNKHSHYSSLLRACGKTNTECIKGRFK